MVSFGIAIKNEKLNLSKNNILKKTTASQNETKQTKKNYERKMINVSC